MTQSVFILADSLTEKFKTRDPLELIKALGISLIFTELPPSVDGFHMELGGKQAIVLSRALEDSRLRFCAAHELGHALMHKTLNGIFIAENTHLPVGRFEREADLFAAALLLESMEPAEVNTACLHRETGIPEGVIESYFEYKYKPA